MYRQFWSGMQCTHAAIYYNLRTFRHRWQHLVLGRCQDEGWDLNGRQLPIGQVALPEEVGPKIGSRRRAVQGRRQEAGQRRKGAAIVGLGAAAAAADAAIAEAGRAGLRAKSSCQSACLNTRG